MRHLLSEDGDRALQAVMARAPLLAFDFDGTLAPIVASPDQAEVPERVSRALAALAEELPVAVITGRSVADVRPRLGFEPRFVVGNHGAEQGDHAAPPPGAAALDSLRERVAARAEPLHRAGVIVEDKRYSLALHYRLAPDQGAALQCIESLLQGSAPMLHRFGGKCVVNVVVAGQPDKGDALVDLVRRTGAQAAVFFGDDVNDEAVFLRAPPHWLTVRIGNDEPSSAAMFFLESDYELANVLERMHALRPAR
jgi:trehalose 6-phosphate phosphatase